MPPLEHYQPLAVLEAFLTHHQAYAPLLHSSAHLQGQQVLQCWQASFPQHLFSGRSPAEQHVPAPFAQVQLGLQWLLRHPGAHLSGQQQHLLLERQLLTLPRGPQHPVLQFLELHSAYSVFSYSLLQQHQYEHKASTELKACP